MNVNSSYTLRQLVQYFFKLGHAGFGGPVALIGYMHRDLVEERKWISEEEYKDGLALAQLAPGPLAAQLGIQTDNLFSCLDLHHCILYFRNRAFAHFILAYINGSLTFH